MKKVVKIFTVVLFILLILSSCATKQMVILDNTIFPAAAAGELC